MSDEFSRIVWLLALWAFTAFWLWLGLMALFGRVAMLRSPVVVVAAILGWVGAAVLLEWVLPGSWLASWWDAHALIPSW